VVARLILLVFLTNAAIGIFAQSGGCILKPVSFNLHFGKGNVQDINTTSLALYNRVSSSCPQDGYYSFCSSTDACFRGDWHTLQEDHTPGDAEGNMLLVNSAYDKGVFLSTSVKGFKSETIYQFGVWLMNVCKPSWKCPYPLLPNLTIRLQTPAGKKIAEFVTGDLPRQQTPQWKQYRAQFTVPPFVTELIMTLVNNAPGGCGNDFALDDITFRQCVPPNPVSEKKVNTVAPVALKKQQPALKKEIKKPTSQQGTEKKRKQMITITDNQAKVPANDNPSFNLARVVVPVPLPLKQRTNLLIKEIETSAGEIRIDLYDNGEIDGDTVSVYHNNELIASEQRLSQKPLSLHLRVSKIQPHHELVMVANNLGSIPPNTSLMIVTTKDKQYRVFISSTKQQNAKVVIGLKE
jgi:hypothetical protein